MSFVLWYLIWLLLFLAVIAGASWVIYRFTAAHLQHPAWRYLAWAPPIAVVVLIYYAVNPSESIYYDDYYWVTGGEVPPGTDIILREATFPDQFGDYTSVAVFSIGNQAYNDLQRQLLERGWVEASPLYHTDLSIPIKTALSDTAITLGLTPPTPDGNSMSRTEFGYVGFRSDGETVVVERSTW